MAEEKKRLVSAGNSKLPMASEIPDEETFQEVRKLLKQALKLKVEISEREDKLQEVKDQLQAVCEAFSMPGFKLGLAGFQYDGFITRKSLSKEALLAAGVAAQTIEDCYLPGTPFVSAKIIAFDYE